MDDIYADKRALERKAEAEKILASVESKKVEHVMEKELRPVVIADAADSRKWIFRGEVVIAATILLSELLWLVLG